MTEWTKHVFTNLFRWNQHLLSSSYFSRDRITSAQIKRFSFQRNEEDWRKSKTALVRSAFLSVLHVLETITFFQKYRHVLVLTVYTVKNECGVSKRFTVMFPGIFQKCGQPREIVNEQIAEMAASADRSLCYKKEGGGVIVICFTIFAYLLIRFISRLSFDLSQPVWLNLVTRLSRRRIPLPQEFSKFWNHPKNRPH